MSVPQLREVRRLPARKTVVALFVINEPGKRKIKHRDFADMGAAYFIDNEVPLARIPSTLFIFDKWSRTQKGAK